MKTTIENAIIVRNKTRLEQLVKRFNTQAQAKFMINKSQENFYSKAENISLKVPSFKKSKNAVEEEVDEFSQYEDESSQFYDSLSGIKRKLSESLKIKEIDADYLPNYLFSEKDVVIVVGQDGLVANTAKYVNNIPIIAINPDPQRFDGVLLPFRTDNFHAALHSVLNENYEYKLVTMAEVKLNDGQRLLAFNDLFIGVSNHGSARYKITFQNSFENQSSSGIIISTGAGSTGWLSSLFNMSNGISKVFSSNPTIKNYAMPLDTNELVFVVREPFKSKTSNTNITAGIIGENNRLIIESYMPSNGVIFSDGIQTDFLQFNSGAIAQISIATEKAKLVQ